MKEILFNPKINYIDLEPYQNSAYEIAAQMIIDEEFHICKQILIMLIHLENKNINPSHIYYILRFLINLDDDYIIDSKKISSVTDSAINPVTEYARGYINKYIDIFRDGENETITFELKNKIVKRIIEGYGICTLEDMEGVLNKYPYLISMLCKDVGNELYINDLGKLLSGEAENSYAYAKDLLIYLNN